MSLPNSYTQKPNSIPVYFDAILDAHPPERFSIKFMEKLDFTSHNDRLFIGILKDLGFLNTDGVPQQRYYDFLDRTQSRYVLAEAIKESFSDLYAVNKNAHSLNVDDVRNKLRTLFSGKKSDLVIGHISKTFKMLCDYADFSKPSKQKKVVEEKSTKDTLKTPSEKIVEEKALPGFEKKINSISLDSLQYHINIVLPESRDQAVYDAIFKSLREHLG